MKLYTTYDGKQFNEMTKGTTFIKVLNKEENHNGFQYVDGLNIDTNKFNPTGICNKGGLYFASLEEISHYVDYGDHIRIIEVPDDAKVYVEKRKYKSNKLILRAKHDLYELETTFNKPIYNVLYCPKVIKYIKNPSLKEIKYAIKHNCNGLKYAKNQTPELCKLAVQKNGYALQYVKEQTPELCKLAVQQNGFALQYVKEQTPELCELAVQKNGYTLQYVKEQTPELCKLAVQDEGMALEYVKERTPEICKLAVQNNGLILKYVKKQTPEICKLAVKQNKNALQYVKDEYKSIFTNTV